MIRGDFKSFRMIFLAGTFWRKYNPFELNNIDKQSVNS